MFAHNVFCRFYGDSHPTKDASVENLKLLSSRQALADFANFHDIMVTQYKLTDKNKWVCFGGSYSGALAAWLRQLYPKAMVGAVATSAPVLAELDYVEYMEVTEQSLATEGGCGQGRGFMALSKVGLSSPKGWCGEGGFGSWRSQSQWQRLQPSYGFFRISTETAL